MGANPNSGFWGKDQILREKPSNSKEIRSVIGNFPEELEVAFSEKPTLATYSHYYLSLRNHVLYYYFENNAKNVAPDLKEEFSHYVYVEAEITHIESVDQVDRSTAYRTYLKNHAYFSKTDAELPDLSKFESMPDIKIIFKAMDALRKLYLTQVKHLLADAENTASATTSTDTASAHGADNSSPEGGWCPPCNFI